MFYILAKLLYFGVEDPHYSVYQGLAFSTMENCQQYLEKYRPEMSHDLWEMHKDAEIDGEIRKLKKFGIQCVAERPPPSWKEV